MVEGLADVLRLAVNKSIPSLRRTKYLCKGLWILFHDVRRWGKYTNMPRVMSSNIFAYQEGNSWGEAGNRIRKHLFRPKIFSAWAGPTGLTSLTHRHQWVSQTREQGSNTEEMHLNKSNLERTSSALRSQSWHLLVALSPVLVHFSLIEKIYLTRPT